MVDFWFNHFNVFAGKGATRGYLTEYERDAIRPHVLGKFRDLLQATAESPAMLFYLDNWQSAAPTTARDDRRRDRRPGRRCPRPCARAPAHPSRRRRSRRHAAAAEPPAARHQRELRPRADGAAHARRRRRLHAEGRHEVARAFTGWTIREPAAGRRLPCSSRACTTTARRSCWAHRSRPAAARRRRAGARHPRAAHPSTARFIATKLARRFVADDPPPALVDRAAARFRDDRRRPPRGRARRSSRRRSSSPTRRYAPR